MTEKYLTDADHNGLDKLLNVALDGYKNGEMSRETARSGLAHVIAAIDTGNYAEARYWFQNPDMVKEEIGGGETFD
ncbi:TPA: hypothetical protein PFE14_004422 [Kluyvera ascorbata]|nr:hypothetical protein [Kluyvera ascorbata]